MKLKTLVIAILLVTLLGMHSCSTTPTKQNETALQSEAPPAVSNRVAMPDTITSLDSQKDSVAFFKSPDGMVYRVSLNDENGLPVLPDVQTSAIRDSLYCITDIYLGTKRKKAKTTFATKTYKTYQTIAALKATFVADSIMRNLPIPISSSSSSVRVAQEKRNVTITSAYIYAISREDDNDFHVIIGDSLPFNVANLITVELSGLPNPVNAATDSIQNARTTFESFFGEKCSGAYSVFSPPINISVSGSLFFDIDHAAGIVGTGIYKPQSCWEIHPISKILFK